MWRHSHPLSLARSFSESDSGETTCYNPAITAIPISGENPSCTGQPLRQQLVNALVARQAHQVFETAVAEFPPAHFNTKPPNTPYSFWQLLEHLRIAQADILDYIVNAEYQYLSFPDDYWLPTDAQADGAAWQSTIDAFLADRAALIEIIQDPARDLTAQIPHGQAGHSILREVLVVAAHNSYHIGEFGSLRGTLGLW